MIQSFHRAETANVEKRSLLKLGFRSLSSIDLPIAFGLAAITLVIALYFAPRGYQSGFVDMGHDGYQLRQALDLSTGGVIFRDTFDQYGPLSGYLNTVGYLTLGRRLLAMKYFISGWYALIAMALFVVARQWLAPVLAAFSVMVWLGLAPFYQHGIMISAHVYVLFFQTLAVIVALRAPSLEPRRFAVIGALAGLSWAAKQSMGTLFLASIFAYLAYLLFMDPRAGWRRVRMAATAVAGGYFAVIGVALAFLWTHGALDDWYRQTIAFPRDFYLLEYGRRLSAAHQGRMLSSVMPPVVVEFFRLQAGQPLYWWVIRFAVFAAALLQIRGRAVENVENAERVAPGEPDQHDERLVLMASITGFLWLGAFPSANFMHQWWTASLAIPPFVYGAQQVVRRVATNEAAVPACAIGLVLALVGSGIVDRKRAAAFRASALDETILAPPAFRGIRTDLPMKRAFETMYTVMSRYREHHPGTKIVVIDPADGFLSGINESLPFLSALDSNTHAQPVYWNLPVLSTNTYPHYAEVLQNEISTTHPLLVEQRTGAYKPVHIAAYALLAAVESDFGYWYVYAPDHADRLEHDEVSTFLARDGSADSGFAERGVTPNGVTELSTSAAGESRGTVSRLGTRVNLYTWPTDLPVDDRDGEIEPLSGPTFRDQIVRQIASGTWVVDGQAQGRFYGLLKFPAKEIVGGTSLRLRGELYEGGFQVGFVQDKEWSGYVCVTREGPFEALLEIQRSGRYQLELANCVQSTPWQIARRHWVRGTLGMLTGGFIPNRFRISEFGWIRPE
jgi:hypothetical protein